MADPQRAREQPLPQQFKLGAAHMAAPILYPTVGDGVNPLAHESESDFYPGFWPSHTDRTKLNALTR
jgi:hypothetical protein